MNWKKVHHISIEKAFTNVSPYQFEEITGRSRKEDLKDWRNALGCCYALNGLTYKQAGKMINKDHSTIVHYIKRMNGHKSDVETQNFIELLVSTINEEALILSKNMKCINFNTVNPSD